MVKRDSINTTNPSTRRSGPASRKRYYALTFTPLDQQHDHRSFEPVDPLLGVAGLQDRVQKVSQLGLKVRYASLYFAAGIEKEDNELIVLDVIHHFVEILDRYFGNVCELDLIFNFHQAYFILEELVIGGHIMESSKKQVLKMIQ